MTKRILKRILEGVRYLHETGIVHRDLKLENVVMSSLDDKANPVIVDFGLCRFLGPNQTVKKEPYGTIGYAAPEIGGEYDFKVDVWSLGCIMYALICGVLPFQASQHLFQEQIWSQTSPNCKDLVIKML